MPAYSQGNGRGVYPGDQVSVIASTDSVVSGFKSQCVALSAPQGRAITSIRAQVDFNADPGTFEVDLQESDTDVDGDYQTVALANANSGASKYSCFIDYQGPTAKFYRIYAKTVTNTVSPGAIGTLSV